jgi:signal transduction histidine kinase
MFADMLANPALPDEKRIRFAATISRESRRLGDLIGQLLAFNALERGGDAVARVPVDVAALARQTLEEMEATLRPAGMRAESALPREPALALTDPSMLKQALLNLIDNAVKYARDGGIVSITLAGSGENGFVRLRVADAGPGVPSAMRERIFEPFVQGGPILTDKSPGVGLGLSIARGMLRRAGGDLVLLDSRPGATFEIRLPAAPAPQ